jgi:hypothetical protein
VDDVTYERPVVAERRDISAQLGQGVVTSGGGQTTSPTWRRREETPRVGED